MDQVRLQIISQKILEIMEETDLSEDEFFDRCLRQPMDTVVGIKHPDTDKIYLAFCNHKDIGLNFYLPEDLDFNEHPYSQNRPNLSKSELKRQILQRELHSDNHPDNLE